MANKFLEMLGLSKKTTQESTTAKPPTGEFKQTPKATAIDDRPIKSSLPGGRASIPTSGGVSAFQGLPQRLRRVSPQFIREYVRAVRALSMYNVDVSQAIHNIVSLGNTGHKVYFDKKVSPEQIDLMRNHLVNKRKNWAPGQAGMDGAVNKMFAQVLIGGALSNEWVVNNDITGIQQIAFVNPEEIEFLLSKDNINYNPYQLVPSLLGDKVSPDPVMGNMVKLNPNTYKYFALNGDTEIPYGFPPYMSVVDKIKTQNNMDINIDFVVDQLGLIGFLETLIQKPDMTDDESDEEYNNRLETLLSIAKTRVLGTLKDGVAVGFKDDHEFNFHTAAKGFDGVNSLYQNNELMIASGLKQDASLLGRNYNTSETNITVVFMKMLSELRNIQNLVKTNLEFGYALELRLAGFKFDFLEVKFNRSTIQDDLKYQQAEEIKVRNVKDKRLMGIIDQNTAADELGYEEPASQDAIVPWEVIAGVAPKTEPGLATDGAKKKTDRKAQKNKSAKTGRGKKKAVTKN